MGDFFRKIKEWVSAHPYMSLALAGGILLLIYLWYSSQQQAAAQAQAASQAGTSGPDDTIQSLEIQAGAQLQAAQLQAQATNAQTAAQLEALQLQYGAQAQQNNSQTMAALTLGLAQAGDSTSSILQLLGAQPGATPVPSTITPTTTAVTTPTGSGNQTAAPVNPAPMQQLPAAVTPAAAANVTPATAASLCQGCSAAELAYFGIPNTPAAQSITQGHSTDQSNFTGDSQIYEQDVTGGIAGGGSYGVSSAYYATPAAAANLAQILGTQAVVTPSVVGASGGPFGNPATEDIVTPSGTVDAGQLLNELQSTAPGVWGTILSGYGIQDTASVTNSIYNMFGPNQAIPQTTAGGAA